MAGLSRRGGAGNTKTDSCVGSYLIPDPVQSDRQAGTYYGDDLDDLTLIDLRVQQRRVEEAWNNQGKKLDRDDPRRRWLEWRWQVLEEARTREEAALGLARRPG